MVRKEDLDFYCGFSRKELQSLCKKYNLPANRSSSDMAESLASHSEKNSLNSVVFEVGSNQDSLAMTSRVPASRTWDVNRDSYGNELDITREDCFQGPVAREPGLALGDYASYQERNGSGVLVDSGPPYIRKSNERDQTANSKKDVISRTDSRLENRMQDTDSGDSPSSSSFEFHVSLEEGISLSVDLNFNPSDWINSMKDKVNVYDSIHRRKSPDSDDLGINNPTECKKQKSSDNSDERSLVSSAIEPCSRIKERSEICKESIPDSSGPCVESYCVDQVDLDCVNPLEKKLASDSLMVVSDQNHQATEIPVNPSIESFRKIGNSSTVICLRGAGSELSSSEADVCPLKTSRSSTMSSPELFNDIESTESLQFQCNGGKNCLPPNSEEEEKSEVLSEQVRSE